MPPALLWAGRPRFGGPVHWEFLPGQRGFVFRQTQQVCIAFRYTDAGCGRLPYPEADLTAGYFV